jgi:hypothetical protein
MASTKKLDVDFERDNPLTAEDIEALARARDLLPLPTAVYLEWLTLLSGGKPFARELRRNNTDGDEPFEL